MSDKASEEVAQIVLQLDIAITDLRARKPSSLRAVAAAGQLMRRMTQGIPVSDGLYRVLPARPDRVELAILTALADTYGDEMLINGSLGYALCLVAEHGGVALVQRVLWGDSACDAQLTVMLTAAGAEFTQISLVFPDAFFAEANALIAACCPTGRQ